jgi:FHS family L-fucose permease-like MFS transporter
MFVFLAGVFAVIHLPHVGEGKAETGIGALRYPHVVLGVLAIFMYVGGEVSIGSAIINYLGQKTVAGLTPVEASKYVSLFWGGMLIGRFMASVSLSEISMLKKQLLLLAIPVAAYFIYPLVGIPTAPKYLILLGLCWVLFQCGFGRPGLTLVIFAATIVGLLITAIAVGGHLAMWCIVGIGLFTSIGWPNIFSLALDGMGVLKSQVSSLLVMAVLGGALLPPLQGYIADNESLQFSFLVPLIAYAYVGFYGAAGHRIGRSRIKIAA